MLTPYKAKAKVKELANTERNRMIETFKRIDYFSATTDIWTRSNRSFIAVSVHYFEPNGLKLESKYIACEHFPGRHTHDQVAGKLHNIFERYGILEKVFFVTSDGAGEYVAAFSRFGNYHQMDSSADSDVLNEDFFVESESDELVSVSNPDSDSESFVTLYENASASASDISDQNAFVVEEINTSLPLLRYANRVDCGAHKLDKLASIDAVKAKENDHSYALLHDLVFDKLEKIWNLKDSRIKAEMFEMVTGRKLTRPHRIRWLKTFQSVNYFFYHFDLTLTTKYTEFRI